MVCWSRVPRDTVSVKSCWGVGTRMNCGILECLLIQNAGRSYVTALSCCRICFRMPFSRFSSLGRILFGLRGVIPSGSRRPSKRRCGTHWTTEWSRFKQCAGVLLGNGLWNVIHAKSMNQASWCARSHNLIDLVSIVRPATECSRRQDKVIFGITMNRRMSSEESPEISISR
jgi:hypothetical protein